jgi:hypothetical protein
MYRKCFTLLLCLTKKMPFSLNNLDTRVRRATHPEKLRDILVLIFREVVMRHNGNRTERTGFEAATEEELHLAFFRTVNELLIRWGCLRDQLGNVQVSIHFFTHCSTQRFPEYLTFCCGQTKGTPISTQVNCGHCQSKFV